MRFIATADLQIGMPAHRLGEHRAAFAHARLAAIGTLGRLAHEVGASAVVIAGDLFDRDPVGPSDLAQTLDALGDLGLPVLVLPGNHDSHHPASVWVSKEFERARPEHLTVLLDEPVTIEGVEFHGAPLRTRKPDARLVEELLATLPADGAARVVVGHGAVDAVSGDHGDPSTLRLAELTRHLAEGRARLVVLGDRHSTLEVDPGGRVWYPGAPEPTDFGDDDGGALVIDLGDPATAATPVVERRRTGTWRFERVTPELTDAVDVAALLERLEGLPSKATTVVEVRPRGAIGTEDLTALETGLGSLAARFPVLDRRLERLVVVPDVDELDALPLPVYARRVAEELTARVVEARSAGVEDPPEAAELRLLLRFAATVAR